MNGPNFITPVPVVPPRNGVKPPTVKRQLKAHKNAAIVFDQDVVETGPKTAKPGILEPVGVVFKNMGPIAADIAKRLEIKPKPGGWISQWCLAPFRFLRKRPAAAETFVNVVATVGFAAALQLTLTVAVLALAAVVVITPVVGMLCFRGLRHAKASIMRESERLSMVRLFIEVRKQFAPQGRLVSELDDLALVACAARHGFDADAAQRLAHALNAERNTRPGAITLDTTVRALDLSLCGVARLPVPDYPAKNLKIAEVLLKAGLAAEAFPFLDATQHYHGFWNVRNWWFGSREKAWIESAVAAESLEGLREAVVLRAGKLRGDVHLALADAELRASQDSAAVTRARTHYAEAAAHAPHDGATRFGYGRFLNTYGTSQPGDAWPQALGHLQAASVAGHTEATHVMALHALQEEETSTAHTLFGHLVAGAPGVAAYHLGLARVHVQRGDDTAALASLDQAIACDRTCAPAHFERGQLLKATQPQAAIDAFQLAMRWDGQDMECVQALQQMLMQRGDAVGAIRCNERLARMHYRRALRSHHDVERATVHYENATELAPDNARYRNAQRLYLREAELD